MADPVFPKSVRLAALILHSHGRSLKVVGNQLGISYQTVYRWAQKCKVSKFDHLTEEQAEEKLEIYAEEMRALSEEETDPHVIRAREALNRHKFGGSKEHKNKAALALESLGGDLDKWKEDLNDHFALVVEQMESATTPEQQIAAVQGGILLRQLKMVLEDPPPITTMADFEKLHKMIRENFSMDEKRQGQGEGLDLRIANAKVGKGRVIEAEPGTPEKKVRKARKKVPKKR